MAKNEVKKFKLPCATAARNRALEASPEKKGKFFSFEHARKDHDAILLGASQRKVILCNSYNFYMIIRKR